MSHLRLAWEFPTDLAELTASSEVGNMLARNLQNQQPAMPWRSKSVHETLDFQFTEAAPISFFFIYAHNLSSGATIDVFFYVDQKTDTQVSVDLRNRANVLGFGLDTFGVCPFGSTSACRVQAGVYRQLLVFTDTPRPVSGVRFHLTDASNAHGYLQIGRLIAGTWWSPDYGADYGYKNNLVITSSGKSSRAGAWRVRQMPLYREINLKFSHLTVSDEAFLEEMIHHADTAKNVFYSIFPEKIGTAEGGRHTGLGFISTFSGIERRTAHSRSASLTLREAI